MARSKPAMAVGRIKHEAAEERFFFLNVFSAFSFHSYKILYQLTDSLSMLRLKRTLVIEVALLCQYKNTQGFLLSLWVGYEIIWKISILCSLMIMLPDNAGFARGND